MHLFILCCFFQGFYHQLFFFFLLHCVGKFTNSRNDDKSSRWDNSRSSSRSKYANQRFVHLFMLCCFFQGFYNQLIFFFLFHCVAKFTNSRNDDKKKNFKFYGPFLSMGFNWLKATATSRRQFTFYHSLKLSCWEDNRSSS